MIPAVHAPAVHDAQVSARCPWVGGAAAALARAGGAGRGTRGRLVVKGAKLGIIEVNIWRLDQHGDAPLKANR